MYEIWGKPVNSPVWELIDVADSRRDRDYLLMEYRLSFGPEWTWRVVQGTTEG